MRTATSGRSPHSRRGARDRRVPRSNPRRVHTERNRTGRWSSERVSQHHERVIVTKNGRETAVLMSVEDLESLEETLEILGNREIVAELLAASSEIERGGVVRGGDAVRQLLN
ncbi:MAG: type II toxin-antitoxin system Phd/YefM family antitoxin [Acidimicrobiales bacterium]